MSWDANSMFKKLLHGKRKSALLNLTWSGLLCRVVWSVSQLLYLLQRAGHFKFFSPSFFVGLELVLTEKSPSVLRHSSGRMGSHRQNGFKSVHAEHRRSILRVFQRELVSLRCRTSLRMKALKNLRKRKQS